MIQGIVFNIQSYSLHDGQGIRTTVFLKGCSLRCQWCANPESQSTEPELFFNQSKCIFDKGCNLCEKICPVNAINNGQLEFDKCIQCLKCVSVCPSHALDIYGQKMSIDEVMNILQREQVFYLHGNGGVTLSGGEPLLQSEFAVELLKSAKSERMNTSIETCGYCAVDTLLSAAQYLDFVFFDVKFADDMKHQKFTGVSNKKILSNLKILCEEFPKLPVRVRTPVIPSANDNVEEIAAIKSIVDKFENCSYELLPFHRFGFGKYSMLGRKSPEFSKLDVNIWESLLCRFST